MSYRSLGSDFAIIGRSVAGKAICHLATRWLPALLLTFINPASVVFGYGRDQRNLIFDWFFFRHNGCNRTPCARRFSLPGELSSGTRAKDEEIRAAPDVCLAFADTGSNTYLSITGRAEILHDVAKTVCGGQRRGRYDHLHHFNQDPVVHTWSYKLDQAA
jgi:hypothetical protein